MKGPQRAEGMRRGALLLVVALVAAGCERSDGRPAPVDAGPAGARVAEAGPPPAIPDSAFGALVEALSEPAGYFDTDNLISNEASYLHVVGALARRGVRGGAYLGVGPGQNFSYMARIRPELAFLIDVRRDNLLQHLWYKALFERSGSRLEYLCLMVGRACGGASGDLALEAVVRRVDAAPPVDTLDALVGAVVAHAADAGVALTAADRSAIRSIHERFARAGLDLRFNTHGRAPRPGYPTLRRLILERDRAGNLAGYLVAESDYRYLKALQEANRVVPVVGDLAGDHAVAAIGEEVRRRGREVSALYVSNVEFYLFGDGAFPRWMSNLATVPLADDAVVIRSYFNRFRTIPETVPGYTSTQLVQSAPALLADWEEGRILSYWDLVGR